MRAGINRTLIVAVVAVVALAVTGCGGGTAHKTRGTPITLRLATPDRQGLPGAKAIAHFRDEVAERSHGAIRITPVYEAAGTASRFDQVVANFVRTGRVEMALIPARAWDQYHITSLRALQAPFLIRDRAVLEEVVTGGLATPLLKGLGAAGVTGVALWPESLRHPFAFKRPVRSPHDFAGLAIRAPSSRASYRLLRRLGAKPVDLAGDALKQAVRDGSVAAAESGFELAAETLPRLGTGTSNITFFPKVNVLVANSRALGRLDDHQRNTLAAAARGTLDWVKDNTPSEQAAAHSYCHQGGRVVAANPSDLAALVTAARPIYAELERDPRTQALIGRIRALRQQSGAPAAAPTCGPASAARSVPASPGRASKALDGVYRTKLTVEEMVAAGVNEARARDNAGVHTITLSDGRLRDTLIPDATSVAGKPCDGTYALAGQTFTFRWTPGTPCSGDFTATWSLAGGKLRLADVRDADLVDRTLWGLKPFRKIGE
jgi:TRAP-type C4-dicarboxylate transport system substrate-binding protein